MVVGPLREPVLMTGLVVAGFVCGVFAGVEGFCRLFCPAVPKSRVVPLSSILLVASLISMKLVVVATGLKRFLIFAPPPFPGGY